MFQNERQEQIYKLLEQRGYLSVKTLAKELYISESSIRRDLMAMERASMIKRSYGGAKLVSAATNVIPFRARSYRNVELKRRIANVASALIQPGDIVFLDQSSTSYFLALLIMGRSDITVVTNNLEILNLLFDKGTTVHSTGGTVSKNNPGCLLGSAAERTFEEIYADIAFFSASSLSDDGMISDCTREEVFLRRSLLKRAKKKVFLCDSTKLGTISAYVQCSLSDVNVLISDADCKEKYMKFFDTLTILSP